mmetsp:Transcript_14383/g.20194  ORF Transcript_14383/g.20194 Transcript_14383/m.20194 type:complete len:102 (-) Transcript_14383:51-356(-)
MFIFFCCCLVICGGSWGLGRARYVRIYQSISMFRPFLFVNFRAYPEMTFTAITAPLFPNRASVTSLSLHLAALHSVVLPCFFEGKDSHTLSTSYTRQLYVS